MNTSSSLPVEEVLDEITPLLVPVRAGEETEPAGAQKSRTPLPKVQLAILMLLNLAEPITAHCIFPFINQLVSELDITGGDPKKVGYYAGIIESTFFAMEALFVFQWARLSDHIGRKPVLLVGIAGLCISMLCFGLSKTFWGLVVSRSLVGVLNGNSGVSKSMVGEITDETNIAQGFACLPIAWSVGYTVGPFLGGQLAKPHDRWPNVFSHPFWLEYPYFLPCAASAAISTFTFIVTAIFLKETLHTRRHPLPPACDSSAPALDPRASRPPPLRQVLTRRVLISVANYAALALLDIAFVALLPLFLATPVPLGGLGLAPPAIGLILGGFGLLNGTLQALVFAPLVSWLGARRVFRQGLLMFVPLFALFPVMSLWAKRYGMTGVLWALVVLQQVLLVVMDMAYGAIFIFIRFATTDDRLLGATNGVSQVTASVMRAIGPAAATSLFAASLEHGWLGGYAVYLVLVGATCVLFGVSAYLPRDMWESEREVDSGGE
ncbi:MFS general substrate transporter [Lenzites betulinus]|nr:MFS general substrate transporter [Lenzites betulinus]